MTPRAQLKTGIWVDALIRRAQVTGAFACVTMRGDRDAGSVLVVVRAREGLTLYAPERDMRGDRVWRGQRLDAEALDQAIKMRLNFDADLNVVEIEDREGRSFIDETVIEAPSSVQAEPNPNPETTPKAAQAVDALAAAKALFRGQ